jgi:hypothetical protein
VNRGVGDHIREPQIRFGLWVAQCDCDSCVGVEKFV